MLRKLCPSFTCSVANVTRPSSQLRVDVCRAHTSTKQCILYINLFSSLSNILIIMFTGAIVLLIVVLSSKLIIVVPHETYLFYIKRPNSQRPLLEMLAAVSDDFSNCRCSSHNRHSLVCSIYATVYTVSRLHFTDIRACPTGPVQWGSSLILWHRSAIWRIMQTEWQFMCKRTVAVHANHLPVCFIFLFGSPKPRPITRGVVLFLT